MKKVDKLMCRTPIYKVDLSPKTIALSLVALVVALGGFELPFLRWVSEPSAAELELADRLKGARSIQDFQHARWKQLLRVYGLDMQDALVALNHVDPLKCSADEESIDCHTRHQRSYNFSAPQYNLSQSLEKMFLNQTDKTIFPFDPSAALSAILLSIAEEKILHTFEECPSRIACIPRNEAAQVERLQLLRSSTHFIGTRSDWSSSVQQEFNTTLQYFIASLALEQARVDAYYIFYGHLLSTRDLVHDYVTSQVSEP